MIFLIQYIFLMSQLVSSVLEAYLFQFLNWYHMFFKHNVKDLAIAIHEVVEGVLPGCGQLQGQHFYVVGDARQTWDKETGYSERKICQ